MPNYNRTNAAYAQWVGAKLAEREHHQGCRWTITTGFQAEAERLRQERKAAAASYYRIRKEDGCEGVTHLPEPF